MYQIRFTPKAEKYVKKIKDNKLKELIKNYIKRIQENPYIGTMKKGELAGICGLDLYYNKTNYEISYKLYDDKKVVVIIMIGTRENFYDELKKYIK